MSTSPVPGLIPVPPGVAPHPTGITGPQQEYIIVSAVLIPISFIALVLRLYTRGFIVRSFGLEDYTIVFSFAVTIGWLVVCLEGMKFGFGRHLWDVPATAIPTFMIFFIPLGILYIWAPTLAKLSTLFLFHRLSSQKYFRWMIYVVMFITLAYTIAGTFVIALGCDPTKSENQSCVFNFGNAQSILNIFTDLLMLLLPIPLLRALQMPIFQKVVLGVIFSIGSAVVIVSAVRLYYNINFLDQPDFTWFLAKSAFLSVIELHCAIICNCLVVLKPLVNKIFPKLLSNSGSSHHLTNSRQAPFSRLAKSHNIELKSNHRLDSGTDHSSSRIMVTKTYRVNGTREDSESMEDILDQRMPTHYRP